ncbi:cysteine desulfurase NifS [Desulfuribacillus stibiiarsenatis]|uniref:cysteine desulfurase n=1 Tax=Desulfuribacillus stibiiarsenatis TaxID=1390249 RepID=A0A1E5L3S5_9FIRM|nr:cysteine desulfurase family protein [Desulfuribacillus stibiiarsenatis]OEH84589.1 cysteine desulfurase NifS [Desulfuribacillus stibiiarsenatis]
MIYLDNAATTPLFPEVKQVMIAHIHSNEYGNPSSVHALGRKSRNAVEDAREQIALSIHANASEIIFTGSGTESINSAIMGAAFANQQHGKHLITSTIEHHAVLHTCQYLESLGWDVTYIPVSGDGVVDVQRIRSAVRKDTILISIMYANNEMGAIQPIQEIASICKQNKILFHCDMVQAYGQCDINVQELMVDMMSTSAHKIHGPKGIGFLYLRRGLPWHPYIHGGKQERGRRAGTENVAAILGFAKASEVTSNQLQEKQQTLFTLKQAFLDIIQNEIPVGTWIINGQGQSLPSILNISFLGIDAETLMISLDLTGIACSHGSACTSGSLEPSHVLKAMNLSDERIKGALRFSFSVMNTIEEVKTAALEISKQVMNLQRKVKL